MKKHIVVLLVFFSLQSCHQLNLGSIENADLNSPEDLVEISINDGETKRININFSETNLIQPEFKS